MLLRLSLLQLLLKFLRNGSIVNDHSDPSSCIIIIACRTAIPAAFAAGSLFVVLLVSCGIHGDDAEPVAQVGSVRIKRVLAGGVCHLVTVLLLE